MDRPPVSNDELMDLISHSEPQMTPEVLAFWKLIEIDPERWSQRMYRDDGNGFWVVGLIGNKVIYYNDVEEGFNISRFTTYGQLDDPGSEQDELQWSVKKLMSEQINN